MMFYGMLYGTLPFFGDTEDEIIEKIINAPLKFPPKVPVSSEAKDILKNMMNKDPNKRATLLEIMSTNYVAMDDEEVDELIKKITIQVEEMKIREEEK
jgi:serine/threonine protein kinase